MSEQGRQLLSRPERQLAILDGAARAFAGRGFSATSMEDVAQAAGITKLIIYRHFESKTELYRAVLRRVGHELRAELARMGPEYEPSEANVRTVLTVGRRHPHALRLFFVHAAREPEFANFARSVRERVVQGVVASMPTIDERFRKWAAEVSVTFVWESVLTWLDLGDPALDDEFVARCARALRAMVQSWVRQDTPA